MSKEKFTVRSIEFFAAHWRVFLFVIAVVCYEISEFTAFYALGFGFGTLAVAHQLTEPFHDIAEAIKTSPAIRIDNTDTVNVNGSHLSADV